MILNQNVFMDFIFHLQHVLSHAQARPFVCPRCDAGFMAQHQLDAHMKLH